MYTINMSALQDVIEELQVYYGIELSDRDIRVWKRILSKYVNEPKDEPKNEPKDEPKNEPKDEPKDDPKNEPKDDEPTCIGIVSFIFLAYSLSMMYCIFSKNISILQLPLVE
jgi:hypothetical protein